MVQRGDEEFAGKEAEIDWAQIGTVPRPPFWSFFASWRERGCDQFFLHWAGLCGRTEEGADRFGIRRCTAGAFRIGAASRRGAGVPNAMVRVADPFARPQGERFAPIPCWRPNAVNSPDRSVSDLRSTSRRGSLSRLFGGDGGLPEDLGTPERGGSGPLEAMGINRDCPRGRPHRALRTALGDRISSPHSCHLLLVAPPLSSRTKACAS